MGLNMPAHIQLLGSPKSIFCHICIFEGLWYMKSSLLQHEGYYICWNFFALVLFFANTHLNDLVKTCELGTPVSGLK